MRCTWNISQQRRKTGKDVVEISPLAYMRGTFKRAYIVAMECKTLQQVKQDIVYRHVGGDLKCDYGTGSSDGIANGTVDFINQPDRFS